MEEESQENWVLILPPTDQLGTLSAQASISASEKWVHNSGHPDFSQVWKGL